MVQRHECDGRDVLSLLYRLVVLAKMVDGMEQRHRIEVWYGFAGNVLYKSHLNTWAR